jgi:hypothetical protein
MAVCVCGACCADTSSHHSSVTHHDCAHRHKKTRAPLAGHQVAGGPCAAAPGVAAAAGGPGGQPGGQHARHHRQPGAAHLPRRGRQRRAAVRHRHGCVGWVRWHPCTSGHQQACMHACMHAAAAARFAAPPRTPPGINFGQRLYGQCEAVNHPRDHCAVVTGYNFVGNGYKGTRQGPAAVQGGQPVSAGGRGALQRAAVGAAARRPLPRAAPPGGAAPPPSAPRRAAAGPAPRPPHPPPPPRARITATTHADGLHGPRQHGGVRGGHAARRGARRAAGLVPRVWLQRLRWRQRAGGRH